MTELKLEFLLEEPEIPAEVDRLLLSFLKASVEKYSSELFEKLYTKKQSVMKTYCWSCYLPGFPILLTETLILALSYQSLLLIPL